MSIHSESTGAHLESTGTQLESIGPLGWRLVVALPVDALEQRVSDRLGVLRHRVRVPGFRPGKVPTRELRRRYWDGICREEAERLAQSEVRAALASHGLRPVAAPRLSLEGLPTAKQAPGTASPQARASFDVFPPLPPLDLATLEVDVPQVTIDDADVDHMLNRLREQHCSWRPTGVPAQTGDRLSLLMSAQGTKGRWPRKGRQRVEQVVGEEGPAAFLGEALLGLARGQQLESSAKPPIDCDITTEIAAGAGASPTISVWVDAVESRQLPALDTAFVRRFGLADDEMQTLRRHLAETMENEVADALDAERRCLVEQALLARHRDLELPASLLEAEVARLQELAPDDSTTADLETLAAEARHALTIMFLSAEVARQHDLSPDPTRLWEHTQRVADRSDDPRGELDRIWGDSDLVHELEEELLLADVVKAVLAKAQTTDVAMSFRELAERRRRRATATDGAG